MLVAVQRLNGDAMTLAAMRHQVDVAALQSEKMNLSDRCSQQNEAKQQLLMIVRTSYNLCVLLHSLHFCRLNIVRGKPLKLFANFSR